MRNTKEVMNLQRRMLALIGFVLPLLTTLGGLPARSVNPPGWWYSISAAFYATSCIFMIFAISGFAFFLGTYGGYDLGDRITSAFSATTAFLILVFPCKTDFTGPTTGLLNLPTETSNIIHCIDATLLFGSFAYMIGFRFTKTRKNWPRTKKKKERDKIYKICAAVIVAAMISQVITSIAELKFMTIVNETVMLWAFSFAWAVKSGIFKRFNDGVSEKNYSTGS